MKKIIDSFMFFNEFDILKLRLFYLNDIVDHFIISESNFTHSGKPKPYYLDQIIDDIPEEIRKKIIRIKYEPNIKDIELPNNVNEFNYDNGHWKLERQQRELIDRYLDQFSLDDFFMISDVDEIPRKELVESILCYDFDEQPCYVASCQMFYYNFNCLCTRYWPGTVFSNVGNAKKIGCDYFRSKRFVIPSIENAGWHFTYFGGTERIKTKLQSFAHQEYNKDYLINDDHILNSIKSKQDLFGRDNMFKSYNCNEFPDNLRNLIMKIFPQETYNHQSNINVCFSIIPPRFCNLEKVIESFQLQTLPPNKIIVTVPEKYYRFSYEKQEIETICNKYPNLVHLLYADEDYGPATKIYGALKSLEFYPNSSVIVCDDDVIYDERLFECYLKALQTNNKCVWTTDKGKYVQNKYSYGVNGNYLTLPHHNIPKLQGVDTYLFTDDILEKFNSNNFRQYYIDFISKNTNLKSLDTVFLHDDYFISILLYNLKILVGFFYLKYPVYDGLVSDSQIHESLRCHSDEIQMIQKIYENYENKKPIIRCDFTEVNGNKVGEFLVDGELDVEKYYESIVNINNEYGPFKIALNITEGETMNELLDRKTNDIREYYNWQIKYEKMPDNHVDYLFRLKYWNNFHPKVIYDIGSNYLSWYKLASNVWRDAKIYCVDAFSGFKDIYPQYNIDYAIELLSDEVKEVEFYENYMCPGLSTIYPVNKSYDDFKNLFYNQYLNTEIRTTKTLDNLAKEKNWKKPDLIKMDVQGAEVDILKGAQEVISNCNHLILEVQTDEFSMGAPLLNQVEEYMNSIGFILFYEIGVFSELQHDGDFHFVRKSILPHK